MRIFPRPPRHSMRRLRSVARRAASARPFIGGSIGASTIGQGGSEDRPMFRKLALSLAMAGLISQATLPAEAALGVGAFAPPASLAAASPIEKAQFVWGGRRYCWYPSGWRGPGWYQCGFAWRRGLGWGGPAGWHGWRHPPVVVHRPPVRPRPPVHRPRPPVARPPAHHRPPAHRPPAHRPVNRGGSQRR
jgi:hypothetical protein